MADIRRERERRRSDRSRPSQSRSRSRSPRNRRLSNRSPPRRSRSPRPMQGRPRSRSPQQRNFRPMQSQQQQQRGRDNMNRENRENRPSAVEEAKVIPTKIDREKTCPLLLRVFCNEGRHNMLDEYTRMNVPRNELQIYTWKDATLKELMNLVKEVNPKARKKGTFFDFATVFPDSRRNNFIMKDIGSTCAGVKSQDDNVSLAEKKFQIGDFLDIAISTPRERRDVF